MDANHRKGGKAKGGDVRMDRKSCTGMSGDPKKGGHGGKFTWEGDSRLADELEGGAAALDPKDPNYEDPVEEEEEEEEEAVVPQKHQQRKTISS